MGTISKIANCSKGEAKVGIFIWWMERDSNPRYDMYVDFQNRDLKPLRHPSTGEEGFEPPAYGFGNHYFTIKLFPQIINDVV